ncbi:MAG TPA: hypothetical protein VJJ46_10565 [Anaerolineales bacterium]|nr:hypothetical protein [Anaerolineales bacterium]
MARLKQMGLVDLGDRAKDVISGFCGIVVGRTTWLYGCSRLGLQAEKPGTDGKLQTTEWFDEGQVRLMKARVIEPIGAIQPKPMLTGGPPRGEETK